MRSLTRSRGNNGNLRLQWTNLAKNGALSYGDSTCHNHQHTSYHIMCTSNKNWAISLKIRKLLLSEVWALSDWLTDWPTHWPTDLSTNWQTDQIHQGRSNKTYCESFIKVVGYNLTHGSAWVSETSTHGKTGRLEGISWFHKLMEENNWEGSDWYRRRGSGIENIDLRSVDPLSKRLRRPLHETRYETHAGMKLLPAWDFMPTLGLSLYPV